MIKHYKAYDAATKTHTLSMGDKHYEISDHLGNVRTTFSDRKLVADDGNGNDEYQADLISSMDYYPFGAPMQSRFENLEPSVEGTFEEIETEQSEALMVLNADIPGTHGSPDQIEHNHIPLSPTNLDGYWEGRASDGASLSNLYNTGTNYTSSTTNGYIATTGNNDEVNLNINASEIGTNDTRIGLFHKIETFSQSTQNGYFDFVGTKTIKIEADVSANNHNGPVYFALLDASMQVIKQVIVNSGNFGLKHVEIEEEDVDANSIYYIALYTKVNQANTSGWHNMVAVKNWEMTIFNKEVTQELYVSESTFTYKPKYRYGFNGMERDDELKGIGNSYDFGARLYDPRMGRWFSVDPMNEKYPGMSPYIAFGNNPIYYIDPGGETLHVHLKNQYGQIAKRDVQSVMGDHSSMFKVHDNGWVEVLVDEASIYNTEDPGVILIYEMAKSENDDNYLYTVDKKGSYRTGILEEYDYSKLNVAKTNKQEPETENLVTDISGILCVSTTPYGPGPTGQINLTPQVPVNQGNDGELTISPIATYTETVDGVEIEKSRASVVFHELAELFYRTEHGKTRNEAHLLANILERFTRSRNSTDPRTSNNGGGSPGKAVTKTNK